mgnify:CR=1 FL=1
MGGGCGQGGDTHTQAQPFNLPTSKPATTQTPHTNTHTQVVAEKLNFFRYLSHFRSVHRGAYFAELRTTTVRKLLPESWGFMCPVHTPDGAPCGLLNHFTAACSIVTQGSSNEELTSLGIMQVGSRGRGAWGLGGDGWERGKGMWWGCMSMKD